MKKFPHNVWVVTEHLSGMTVRTFQVQKFLDRPNAYGSMVESHGDIFMSRDKAEIRAARYNHEESLTENNPNAACGRPCTNCGACRPA